MEKLLLVALCSFVLMGCNKQSEATSECQNMFDVYDKYTEKIKSAGASNDIMNDIKKQRSYFEKVLEGLPEENKSSFCKKVADTFNKN